MQVLRDYLEEEAERFPSNAYRMGFITNHDENSWNGTVEERYGDAGDAMGVLAATLLDMPSGVLWPGIVQHAIALRFFEKDTVEWGDYSKADFYRQLNDLQPHARSALERRFWRCAPQVLETSCRRRMSSPSTKEKNGSTVVVILNLSDEAQMVALALPEAPLELVMGQGTVEEWATGQTLQPWGYSVLATNR